MDKELALRRIADEIARCPLCRKGGTGKAVPGEGSAHARIMFIGEAPGKEEAKIGRPFMGRSGRFLRRLFRDIGLAAGDIFITSPGHYLPLRGTPSRDMIMHGREHLFKQIAIIDPDIIVLLGKTACTALLDRSVEVAKEHGTVLQHEGRRIVITFHPAYAMRFPAGKSGMAADFARLKKIIAATSADVPHRR